MIAGMDPTNVRILFADGHPRSPFDSAWGKIFSGGKPPLRKRDLANRRVCLRHAVFAFYGYASPMTINWFRADPCKTSSWLGAFSHQVTHLPHEPSEVSRGRRSHPRTPRRSVVADLLSAAEKACGLHLSLFRSSRHMAWTAPAPRPVALTALPRTSLSSCVRTTWRTRARPKEGSAATKSSTPTSCWRYCCDQSLASWLGCPRS